MLDGAAGATGTLNTGDQISGGAGIDTLNVLVTAASTPAVGNVIKDVEIINFTHVGASGALALSSANYSGITQLWQVDNTNATDDFQNVAVSESVVAGFRSTGTTAAAAITAGTQVNGTSATQKSATVALDGVDTGSAFTFGTVGAFETVTVNGSVVTNGGANALIITTDNVTTKVNLGLTSNTTVTITEAAAGTTQTVDASTSTGNLTLNLGTGTGFAGVKSVKGGSGNDTLTVDFDDNADKLAVDAGAGNDTVTVQATVAAGTNITNEGTVTLGAGKDTLTIGAVTNISVANATAADAVTLVQNLITVTDFKTSEDVLNFNGNGIALTTGQLDTAKNAATLLAAVQSVEAITGAAGDTMAVFSWGGDAYVFIDDGDANGVDGGDGLIKLTGVDATLFTNIQNGNLVL